MKAIWFTTIFSFLYVITTGLRYDPKSITAHLTAEPSKAVVGQPINLTCSYNIHNNTLYSVKFYKGNIEFYRYVPADTPNQRVFSHSSIDVIGKSNNYVIIKPLSVIATGKYSCEVACDAPSFDIRIATKYVTVESSLETRESKDHLKPISAKLIIEGALQPTVGQAIKLTCSYNIEGLPLYSIKFFKDGTEFFRHIVKETPSQMAFKVDSIEVINKSSNSVTIRPRNVNASGTYACEVSSDAPTFKTVMVKQNITFQPVFRTNVSTQESKTVSAEFTVQPSKVAIGQLTQLTCTYNITQGTLYAVKFYKDRTEFYRYIPTATPAESVFPLQFIEIANTSNSRVVIKPTHVNASGTYICEITLDAPMLGTIEIARNITVEPLLKSNPKSEQKLHLHVTPSQATVGEFVQMDCDYEEATESTYNIKFYKDGVEFYRHTPLATPDSVPFPLDGIKVIEMNGSSIVVQLLNETASGSYSCELSSFVEQSFSSKTAAQNITVLSLEQKTGRECDSEERPFVYLDFTPEHPLPGESVKLTWSYCIGNQSLYSIQLYKDGEKFYRFLPNQVTPSQFYEEDGVVVKSGSESNKSLVLSPVNRRTSGVYRCEISTRSPSLLNLAIERRLQVT